MEKNNDEKNHHDFPYISIITTGKNLEIVLTRGVGLHTVMGITIDKGPEAVMRNFVVDCCRQYREVLLNKKQ